VRSSRVFSQDPTKLPEPEVGDLPKEPDAKQQEGLPYLIEGQQQEEAEKHALLTWTGLVPGDVVSLKEARTAQPIVGSVESRTRDGLIIWIRDDLNDRRAFHFHDCESVQLLR
jgi:hypothetical protein